MHAESWIKTAIVVLVVAVDIAWIAAAGHRFDWPSLVQPAILIPLLIGGWIFYAQYRREERIATLFRETAFLLSFSAAGAMLSYLATGLAFPTIDGTLAAIDRAIGFDWFAYVDFFNRHAWLGRLSSLLYMSTLPLIALSVVLLPVLGHADRARELTLAVAYGALIAIAISAVLPGHGPLFFYHPDPEFYLKNDPVLTYRDLDEFLRVRAGALAQLSLENPRGLIGFPSYHTVLGIVLSLSFRGTALFPAVLAVNLAMLFSVPVDGAHHLTDILGGIVVAAMAFAAAIATRRWAARRHAGQRPAAAAIAVPGQWRTP